MAVKRNKSDLQQLAEKFRSEAKPIVDRIAADRDALRTLVEEYRDILETVSGSLEYFEDGLEQLSQQL